MKHRFFFIIASLIIVCLSASKCKKDKPPVDPVSQLPPETQTGANTFGCLVDGKVFLPKGAPFGGPILQCAYQYLDNGSSKGFYFQLSASHRYSTQNIKSIALGTENLKLKEGAFVLEDAFQDGKAFGLFSESGKGNYTQKYLPGLLTITKFDEINQIVSGTFWFSVVVSPGDTIQITDGRFDMQFTK
jgi:hypothetical protein